MYILVCVYITYIVQLSPWFSVGAREKLSFSLLSKTVLPAMTGLGASLSRCLEGALYQVYIDWLGWCCLQFCFRKVLMSRAHSCIQQEAALRVPWQQSSRLDRSLEWSDVQHGLGLKKSTPATYFSTTCSIPANDRRSSGSSKARDGQPHT